MNYEGMLKPALIAGVLLGILSTVPYLSFCCCIWSIGGGVLAAYLYVKDSPIAVTLGCGVVLGLLTGIIGTVVDTLFSIPILVMSDAGTDFLEYFQRFLDGRPNLPAETRDAFQSMLAWEGIIPVLFIMSAFFNLVTYSLVAMLGGTIGVALFEKRPPGSDRPDASTAYQPPATLPPPPPPEQPPQ